METSASAHSAPCIIFHDMPTHSALTLRALLRESVIDPTLKSILIACERGIRTECDILGPQDRLRVPVSRTIQGYIRLIENKGITSIVPIAVLDATAQLGCFGLLASREPSLLSPHHEQVDYLGLCKGVIVAAAAAAVRSQGDLARLCEIIIRVVFRFGLEADRRALSVNQSQGSWAIALPGKTAAEVEILLKEFNCHLKLPDHLAAYISADLPTSITISGPPSIIKSLVSSVLRPRRIGYSELSISAPFHAAHLPPPDLAFIVDFSELDDFRLRSNCTVKPSQRDIQLRNTCLRSTLETLILGIFKERMSLELMSFFPLHKRCLQPSRVILIQPCATKDSIYKMLGLRPEIESMIAGPGFPVANLSDKYAENEVAVIGMAGRFPCADTLEEFWDIIRCGYDMHQPISRRVSHQDVQKSAASNSPACFMKSPGSFDPKFFKISPREARQIDPQHRILLMVTQEALQMIGYSGMGNKRVGTFFGQATDDWRESHIRQDVDIFYVGAGMRAFAPGRLNYHNKWEGPSYSIDTACSASLAALELATRAVQSGDCDIAVVGGGNLCTALPMFEGLAKGGFTSQTGPCKTLCSTADGYCRGEAVGVVILQCVRDAVRENTQIYGVVAGIATNHSAWSSSITRPHVGAQESLMLTTLDKAGVSPSEVDYVELHGTGTQVGDVAEMDAVSRVFDQRGTRPNPLYIGAVKSSVGHCEAAAGIVSLIKALLMLRHNTIPPHCGIKASINPAVAKVMSSDLRIPNQELSFANENRGRSIIINNFNATGGNTTMLLCDTPIPRRLRETDPRSHFPVVVTGHSVKSLRANLLRMRVYLEDTPDVKVPCLSYSSSARRVHSDYRAAFTSTSRTDTIKAINKVLENMEAISSEPLLLRPRVVFAFAGQGTQKAGLAAKLYETSLFFKKTLQSFSSLCSTLGFPSFIELLVNEFNEAEHSTVQRQLATVAIELSLARLWQNWGVEPSAVVGHSIGEYVALCVAGVLSDMDMFSLIGRRAQLMEEFCQAEKYSMLAIRSPKENFIGLLKDPSFKDVEISCYNSLMNFTVGGLKGELQSLQRHLSDRQIKSTLLSVDYAFHSRNIEPILQHYLQFAESISFKTPVIPVFSTLLGEKVTAEGTFSADYLIAQTREPVRFDDALRCFNSVGQSDSERTIWIEFGPSDPVCLSFIKTTVNAEARTQLLPSLTTRVPIWQSISDNLTSSFQEGLDVDWMSYHREYEQNLDLLDLPKYAFDLHEFWIPPESKSRIRSETILEGKLDPLLHLLQDYTSGEAESKANYRSSLSDSYLLKLLSGHSVMGASLCPSSVYFVMAIRAASILRSKKNMTEGGAPILEWCVLNMDIYQPLVAKQPDTRFIGVAATQQTDSDEVSVRFTTHEVDDSIQSYCECILRSEPLKAWSTEWSQFEFLLKSRMEQISTLETDKIIRLTRPVIYKLFSHIVAYSQPFQGLQHITLDTTADEALAEVTFDRLATGADYDVYLVDSFIHFAGFVLNHGIKNDKFAYISNGWNSLRISQGLKSSSKYKIYVRLSADDSYTNYSGDLYAFLEGKIIASCSGLRFSKIRKDSLYRALNHEFSRSKISVGLSSEDTKKDQVGHRIIAQSPLENLYQPRYRESKRIIRQIISQETGVPEKDITDSIDLAQIGLDSILLLAVTDKIQDRLGVKLGSGPVRCAQNISELNTLLTNGMTASSYLSRRIPASAGSSLQISTPLTPFSEAMSEQSAPQAQDCDLTSAMLSIISNHTGVPEDTIRQSNNLSQLGVDSILSLEILDSIRERTGVNLPSSFMHQNPTVDTLIHDLTILMDKNRSASALTADISRDSRDKDQVNRIDKPVSRHTSSHNRQISLHIESEIQKPNLQGFPNPVLTTKMPGPDYKSLAKDTPPIADSRELLSHLKLVHGQDDSPLAPVFLFPPGNGRHNVYNRFPPPSSNNAIYCVESPFINSPDDPSHTFTNVALAYKTAIRRRYPRGPYSLAGYSLGGGYAFEVARLLLSEGAVVTRLVIIDCPVPTPAPANVSNRWFGFQSLVMTGLLDDHYEQHRKEAGEDLPPFLPTMYKHNAASTRAYDCYDPTPFGDRKPDKTLIIWATHGAQEEQPERCLAEQKILEKVPEAEREELVQMRRQCADREWFYRPRSDFDLRGWDKWLGKCVDLEVIEGTHINIIMMPRVLDLARRMYAALGL